MAMQQQKLDAFLLKLLVLLAAGMIVTQALSMASLTSYMFLLSFPVTVLLWVRSIRLTVTGRDFLLIITVFLALLAVLVNASMTGTGLNFSYLRKVIIFAITLLFMQTASRTKIDDSMARFFDTVIDLLVLFLIGAYFLLNIRMFWFGGRYSNYLTFGMDNPNLTALFLMCLYMLEMHRLFSPEKWYWKVAHIVMAVFLALFIVQTRSRNAMVVMVIFSAGCAWLIFRGKIKMKLGKVPSVIIASFPALFLTAYLSVISMPVIQNAFDFLVGEGKKLDSRIQIWSMALSHLKENPLQGAYSEISKGTGLFQMHNTHLDVACSYGIPVLILVCILLYQYVHQQGREYDSKAGYIYIMGFSCAIMMGIGEAALFSGGLGLYVFVGSFLMLASHSEEDKT